MSLPASEALRRKLGVCQWFHFQDHRLLEVTVDALETLGVRHLRTGISWADYHRPNGAEWYDWQMRRLRESGLQVLLSVWHTPPSISMDPALGSASVPPDRTRDYADFIDKVIRRYGDCFDTLELWNEPNNPFKWRTDFDPDHRRFAEMVIDAGNWASQCGKRTVLGGMTLLDYDFVDRMVEAGVTDFVDVFGIHAFPHMWEPYASDWEYASHWHGWEHRISEIEERSGLPVWVTETGLATRRKDTGECRESVQEESLLEALEVPAPRVYWYCLFDLDPQRLAIEEVNDAPREEPEYHMGLVRFNPEYRVDGFQKPAYHALRRALRRPTPSPDCDAEAAADRLRSGTGRRRPTRRPHRPNSDHS